jgi:hypothetical protein
MVLLVESWEDVKAHLEAYPAALALYKLDYLPNKRVRLRVRVGNIGFDRVFNEGDGALEAILALLDDVGAIKVTAAKPDDAFFM